MDLKIRENLKDALSIISCFYITNEMKKILSPSFYAELFMSRT